MLQATKGTLWEDQPRDSCHEKLRNLPKKSLSCYFFIMLTRISSLFLLITLLWLQGCKVVVQDPYGNRLGALDSLNLDSLLRLSSWLRPYSSWSYPVSSSATYYSSSSAVTCAYYLQYNIVNPNIFTWKELYADGSITTRFATDTNAYPGQAPRNLTITDYNSTTNSAIAQPTSSYSYTYHCTGDTILKHLQTDGSLRLESPGDTVYLNYGPNARDSLVALAVHILKQDSLQAATDSLSLYQDHFGTTLHISHFRGDSARYTLHTPSWISLLTETPLTLYAYDSCAGAARMVYYSGAESLTDEFTLLGVSDSTMVSGTPVSWEILVRNRFGYRDIVRLSTQIISPSCPIAITIPPLIGGIVYDTVDATPAE